MFFQKRLFVFILIISNSFLSALNLNNCTGQLRVCFDGELEFDANNNRLCYANKLQSKTVRIAAQGWDSATYSNWIAEILLSEVMRIPSKIQNTAGGLSDYYPTVNGWEKIGNDIIETSNPVYPTISQTANDTYCDTSGDIPCAHFSIETWENIDSTLAEFPHVLNVGILGVIGRNGWYVPSYISDVDPSLLSYKGLLNGTKNQEIFKRPLNVRDSCGNYTQMLSNINETNILTFCNFLRDANSTCKIIDSSHPYPNLCDSYLVTSDMLSSLGITLNVPASISNLTNLFVAPFLADHINLDGLPSGFMASVPCYWQRQDRYQAMAATKGAIWPIIIDDSLIFGLWQAAIVRNEGVMIFDWDPNVDMGMSVALGPRYNLDRVYTLPWTQQCESNRPSLDQQCVDDNTPNYRYNITDGYCDYGNQILWKPIAASLEKSFPDVYSFISKYTLSNSDDLNFYSTINFNSEYAMLYPNMGERRQHAICEWVSQNKHVWIKWIPNIYLEPSFCQDNCNNHGSCISASDGNPVGDCFCDSFHTGTSCDIEIALPVLLGFGLYLSLMSIAIIGAVFSILSLLWVFIKRDTKLFMSSSPMYMYFISIGGLIGNIGAVLKVIQLSYPMAVHCGISYPTDFLITIGYDLILSSLLGKSKRVIMIFKPKDKFQVNVVKQKHVISYVLFPLVWDVVVYVIQSIMDPPKIHQTRNSDGQLLMLCSSGSEWLYATIVPKFIILLFSIEAAFEMSNITINKFNESRALGLIIYNFIMIFVFVFAITVFMPNVVFVTEVDLYCYLWSINFCIFSLFGNKLLYAFSNGYNGDLIASERDTLDASQDANTAFSEMNQKIAKYVKQIEDENIALTLEIKKLTGR